jgi:hypothetical protein
MFTRFEVMRSSGCELAKVRAEAPAKKNRGAEEGDVNQERGEEIIRQAMARLEEVDPARLKELLRQIKEDPVEEADVDLVKRVLGFYDWLNTSKKPARSESE